MALPLIAALVPVLADVAKKVAGNLFPDPADQLKRDQLVAELQLGVLSQSAEIDKISGEVIKTEAGSSNWLAASWRPLTMLTFTGLIVARWLGYSAPGISEAEILELWAIVKLGLGGYVIGRSAEKVAPQVLAAFGRK